MSNGFRVKFYSQGDMSAGFNLNKAEEVLQKFTLEKATSDINEIIELYNIKKYLDKDMRLLTWDESTFAEFKKKTESFFKIIGEFFAKIDNGNLEWYIKHLDIMYTEDFWELINDFKVYTRIEGDTFTNLLIEGNIVLWQVLHHKKLVSTFGKEIALYMQSAVESAELLMNQFLSAHDNNFERYYLPEQLTPQDCLEIIQKYVDSENANPNYLKLLDESQGTSDLPIGDRLRLDAKKKYNKFWDEHFKTNAGMPYGVEVSFIPMQQCRTITKNKNIIYATYSKEWVSDNLDYPTLLNNFIYMFEYVDKWFRCKFVSTTSKLGTIERELGVKGRKEYSTGIQFNIERMKSCAEMQAYRKELDNNSITLESIFKWFFETYLVDEFQARGFIYNPPSEGTNITEKCKILSSAIDGVLKQYRNFCEDGYVDQELLGMSSGQIIFRDLKSMQVKKYVYAESENFKREAFCLFSNQSHLTYTERTKSKYSTFYQMILNEQMLIEDFFEYQKPDIEWMQERGIIASSSDGKLFLNKERAFILNELFEQEVVCPLYCTSIGLLLDELQAFGDIKYESTLFSKPEQKYLNYILNKSEFSNGRDLRNKYIHDTQSQDTKTQELDYAELLKVMVLIIIKINEEFCLKNDM